MVFRTFGSRAFVSAAVWASMTLRVGLRLGGGQLRFERRSVCRLMGALARSLSFPWGVALSDPALADSEGPLEKCGEDVLFSAEPCLGLKKDEVSLLW